MTPLGLCREPVAEVGSEVLWEGQRRPINHGYGMTGVGCYGNAGSVRPHRDKYVTKPGHKHWVRLGGLRGGEGGWGGGWGWGEQAVSH